MSVDNYEPGAADLPGVNPSVVLENGKIVQFEEIANMPLVQGTIYRYYPFVDSGKHDTAVVTKHGRIFCVETRITYDTVISWINGLAAIILKQKNYGMDGHIHVNRRNNYEIEQRRVYADLSLFNEIKDALHKDTREIGWADTNNDREKICKLKQANIANVKLLIAKWDKYISS